MEDFTIAIVSWNVSAKAPLDSEPLHQLLGLEPNSNSYVNIPDMYVVGFQEVKSQPHNILWNAVFDDAWTEKVKEILVEVGLVKVQTVRLQGIQTSIFVKRNHFPHIRDIENLRTRRGLHGTWGNKGAMTYRFTIYGCSLALVNCHLTPHDHSNLDRIRDYKLILNTQVFSIPQTSNILYHDYVFWFGDFNFRLEGTLTSTEIIEKISQGSLESLLKDDQMLRVMKSGDAFSELTEAPVTFPPTYKFEMGYDSYDIRRRPAWTDRITYLVNANVYDKVTLKAEVSDYRSHMGYRVSDHRPVSANFKIRVFRPTVEKMVEFIDIPEWHVGECNKITYKVCSTLETSPGDWIAIYKADFGSLDDYIAYVYVQRSGDGTGVEGELEEREEPSEEVTLEKFVIFSDSSILFEGSYVLVYFSREPRSIYGMSSEFRATRAMP